MSYKLYDYDHETARGKEEISSALNLKKCTGEYTNLLVQFQTIS